MDKFISKYYDGYEGEPNIQFIKESIDGERTVLSLWSGYFDDIMHQFEPAASGWVGLAYYYHLAIGWEEEIWEIPDPCMALTEFKSVNSDKLRFDESSNVLSAICDLIASAIEGKCKMWINKD